MKTFANENRTPLNKCSPKERSAIVEAWVANNAQFLDYEDVWEHKPANCALSPDSIYRTKPREFVANAYYPVYDGLCRTVAKCWIEGTGHVKFNCLDGNAYPLGHFEWVGDQIQIDWTECG